MEKNSIKFTKYSIFEEQNKLNKDGEIFLRDYKFFYAYLKKIKNLFFVNMRFGWTNYQYLI